MKRYETLKTAVLLAGLYLLICPPRAHAYLDPGTGSYILQLVMAALLGGVFALKLSWHRIKFFLQDRFSTGKKP